MTLLRRTLLRRALESRSAGGRYGARPARTRPRPSAARGGALDFSRPSATLVLGDGRRLGYAEYGDASGEPFFFFHGFGSSRLVRHPDDTIASSLGVRLIAVDRPGIGLSDPKPGRTLLDWADDVAALADALGLSSFGVLGWSGGGAYAAACAYRLGPRVTLAGIVSGPAPLVGDGRVEYLRRAHRVAGVAGRAPLLLRLALWHWGRPQRRDPVRFLESAVAKMVPRDRDIMADPRLRRLMIENSEEIYRHGSSGIYEEGLVLARPWGFRLEQISVPVLLWHGEADTTVPPEMGHHVWRAIPDCRAWFFAEEGHHLLYARWTEILATLRGEAARIRSASPAA